MKKTAVTMKSGIPAAGTQPMGHRLRHRGCPAVSLALLMLMVSAAGLSYASETAPKDIEVAAPEKSTQAEGEDDLTQELSQEETTDDGRQITCTTKLIRRVSGGSAPDREEDSSTTLFLGPMKKKEAFDRVLALAGNEMEQEGVDEVSFTCEFPAGAGRAVSGKP